MWQVVLRLILGVITVAIVVVVFGTETFGDACIGAALVTAIYIGVDWFNRPKPARDWHVFDEELPDEISATEREMQAKGRQVLRWPGHCSHGDTFDHGDSGQVKP